MDKIQLEREEIALMIEKGVEFEIERKSIFRFLPKFLGGSKTRKFSINQPYLGTLMLLSAEFLKLDFNEDKIREEGISEVKRLATVSCRPLANIVAISVLSSKWKITLFKSLLATYFLWRLKPSKMLELSLVINYMMNLEGFTTSIRLNAIMKIATPPSQIEEALQED